MPRQQEGLSRGTIQQITLCRRAEGDCVLRLSVGVGVLLGAENNHVGKVPAGAGKVVFVARVLAEDAAGGEDGADGVDDDARGWEGEVAGVVLCVLASGNFSRDTLL